MNGQVVPWWLKFTTWLNAFFFITEKWILLQVFRCTWTTYFFISPSPLYASIICSYFFIVIVVEILFVWGIEMKRVIFVLPKSALACFHLALVVGLFYILPGLLTESSYHFKHSHLYDWWTIFLISECNEK